MSKTRNMSKLARFIAGPTEGNTNLSFTSELVSSSGTGTQPYTNIADLPLAGNPTGAQAFVSENRRLYIWNGTGWYNIALVNTAPTAITGASASYVFATDGTPIEITLISTDPEGLPISWSYAVTSGSLENGGGATATVSQVANVFTITPSTNDNYVGDFSLTFTASDGVNLATATSSFTLLFKILNSKYTTLMVKAKTTGSNTTFVDSSTNNFTITRTGNVTQGTFSPYGDNWSYYFDGSGDGINVSNSVSLLTNGDFTWECWAYFSTLTGNPCLINIGTDTLNRTLLYFDSTNGIRYAVARGGADQFSIQQGSTVGWSTGVWYHIALVRSGNTYTIYRNGTSVATGSSTYSQSLLTSNVNIGYSNASGSFLYFTGYISNARIVNGTAVYTENFTPPTEPLTVIPGTSLLTCQSNTFKRSSSIQGYTGFDLTSRRVLDGVAFNYTGTSTGYTISFIPAISYNTLDVVYGNMANGQFGVLTSGAVLSVNGTAVNATSNANAYGGDPNYHKLYSVTEPGVLYSLSISAPVSGSHDSQINDVYINGVNLTAEYENWNITTVGDVKVTAFSPFDREQYISEVNGGSAYFDGSGDLLSFPASSAFNFVGRTFTVECWIYNITTPGAGNNCRILMAGENNSPSSLVLLGVSSNNSIDCGVPYGSGGGSYTGANAIKNNAWHHIAIVCISGGYPQIYVDGVNKTAGGTTLTVTSANNTFKIGYDTPGTVNHQFNGYISNLRIVNGTALYNSNFTPLTAPLTAVANTQLLLKCDNGNIVDYSGNNNLAVIGNAAVNTSITKYAAGSVYFDGSGDYLTSPSSQNLNFNTGNFTIEAWVNYISFGTDNFIVSSSGTGGLFFGIRQTSRLGIGRTAVAWDQDYLHGMSTGVWNHVAVVRNGSTITIYVNGNSIGSGTNSTAYDLSTTSLTIGSQGNVLFFNGYISDLRITKGLARYTANFTPPTSELKG